VEISRKVFESQQQRRFGTANPERQPLAFWEWMIRASEEARLRDGADEPEPIEVGYTPYQLRDFFGQDGDYSKGPIWNFDRMGATRTPHPDGRVICIAGEHEDYYDPDFCIYNDVVVLDLDGSVEIYGYPKDVFPPTDFHSATLLGDRIIVIGRLGYMGERHPGTTPVFALDLGSYRMAPLQSHGELPGWIFRHEAELGPDGIVIRGGEVWEQKDGEERIRRNFDDFIYDPETGGWKRLTDRKWRQYSICNEARKVFMKGQPFRGCCATEGECWKGETLEIPDFSDTFVYIQPEALFPRHIEYETVFSEVFSLEDRIEVSGIPVSIKVESFSIEIVIEGQMEEAKAAALVEDIRESVEADTGLRCVLKSYA
jgi:hypothetical protein